jgi:uncharacterized protein (DUF433 family)
MRRYPWGHIGSGWTEGDIARIGARVFRDTRMPVSAVFDNLEAGASIDEIVEQFDITREQINAILEFAARSLDAPNPAPASSSADAHSV